MLALRWQVLSYGAVAAVLSVFTLAYAQDGDLRSEGEEVIAQWLAGAGPCLDVEAEVIFVRRGSLLTGNELIFSDAPPMVTARGNVMFLYGGNHVTADEMTLERPGGVVVARDSVKAGGGHGVRRQNKGVQCTQTPVHSPDSDCLPQGPADDSPLIQRLEISTPKVRDRFELILKCRAYGFTVVRGEPWGL
jgi:hypothetical protein